MLVSTAASIWNIVKGCVSLTKVFKFTVTEIAVKNN